MPLLEVRDLTKRYGDVTALDSVDISIDSGEFVIVLGVSGAGKSTLLRCINGLVEPTDGEIRLDDAVVTRSQGNIAMVFQQHNLIGGLSAYKNALTGALHHTSLLRSVAGLFDSADQDRAIEALDMVGLYDQCQQPVNTHSGGQRQRVGIARALVQEPRLMLADEPVASLDPASAERVMAYLKQVSEEEELTTIASLHQINIARQFGERFIGLSDGEVVFDGGKDDLTVDVIDEIYGGIDSDILTEEPPGSEPPGSEPPEAAAMTND